ncbi:uncharacterized protein LOC144480587 [Mustelus asterias]
MAESREAASRNLRAYPAPRSIDGSTAAAVPAGPKCYFCGLAKHPRRRCPAKDAICSGCGKQGHFVKVCRAKPIAKSRGATCVPRAQPSLMQSMAARESPSLMQSVAAWESPSLMQSADARKSPSLMQSADARESPSLIQSAARKSPSWVPSSRRAERETSSVTSSDAAEYEFSPGSTVASIRLDQSQPHQLSKSMMEIKLA